MTARNVLSTTLVAALVSGLSAMPTAAQPAAGSPARPVDIHASMQREVTRAAAEQPARNHGKASASRQNSNGGSNTGGGHTKLILGLVSAAAGIGATVYAVQQARKTEDTLTATPH